MKTPYLFLIIIICISCKKQDIHADKQLEPGYFTKPSDESNNKQSYITNSEDFSSDELMIEFAIIDAKALDDEIIDTLHKPVLVLCMEPAEDEIGIDYYVNGKYRHTFIEKTKLKLINEYTHIPITESNPDNSVTLSKDSISITLKSEPFDKSGHTLQYKDNHLYTIDNEHIWGTDLSLPKTQYQSIKVSIGDTKIEIPAKGFHNVYEPNLDYTSSYYDEINDILYIESLNGDGAGGYVVLWRIEKGVYIDRLVSHGF